MISESYTTTRLGRVGRFLNTPLMNRFTTSTFSIQHEREQRTVDICLALDVAMYNDVGCNAVLTTAVSTIKSQYYIPNTDLTQPVIYSVICVRREGDLVPESVSESIICLSFGRSSSSNDCLCLFRLRPMPTPESNRPHEKPTQGVFGVSEWF